MNAEDYTITVTYSETEGCFVGTVAELPDLSDFGDTYDETYALVIDSINTTIDVMKEKGKEMPQ